MKKIFLMLLVCSYHLVHAQTQNTATVAQWNFQGNNVSVDPTTSGNNDWTYSIISTNKKQYIACGYSFKNNNTRYPVIYKLDNFGNLVWLKRFDVGIGGVFMQVIRADDGYVAIGYAKDASTGRPRSFVVEIDDDGNTLNHTPYFFDPVGCVLTTDPDHANRGFSVALDPNYNSINHIVVGGIAEQTGSANRSGVITKLDVVSGSLTICSSCSHYFTTSISEIRKVLTKKIPASTNYTIYGCGNIATAGNNTHISGVNFNGSSRDFFTQNTDIWLVSIRNDYSTTTAHSNQWNKSTFGPVVGPIVYNDNGRVTARNFDPATGQIKYINPLSTTIEESPITTHLNAVNNKACMGEDMIFTNDNNIAICGVVNYIHLVYGQSLIDDANGCIGNGSSNGYDEYTDFDGYVLKVNPTVGTLPLIYGKNVGHFSGSDFRMSLIEDKNSNFVISGSTADSYGNTDPNLPDNFDAFAENAYIVSTRDDATSLDNWRRSYVSWPNEDCLCIFGMCSTADDGYAICGNNDNHGDDFSVAKFAPTHQQLLANAGTYEKFGMTTAPNVYTLPASTTWSSSKIIGSKVVVPAGVTLTIANTTVQFAASDQLWDYFRFNNNAGDNTVWTTSGNTVNTLSNDMQVGIVVQPGGHLVIHNSTLSGIDFTSVGDRNMWDGIIVLGNPGADKSYANQGSAVVTNSTIENARYGLYVANNWRTYLATSNSVIETAAGADTYNGYNFSSRYNGYADKGGGTINLNNDHFTNCRFGINMQNYACHPSGSTIQNCTFNSDVNGMGDICFYTDANGHNVPANTHLAAWAITDLNIYHNTFSSDNTFPRNVRPTGIVSADAWMNISGVPSMIAGVGPGPGNTFNSLYSGVTGYFTTPTALKVYGNNFDDNIFGVRVSGATNALQISKNTIGVSDYNFCAPCFTESSGTGILLTGCHGYDVSQNTLNSCAACTDNGINGIVVNHGTTTTAEDYDDEVQLNTFDHLQYPSIALQTNAYAADQSHGLQWHCNTYRSGNDNAIFMVSVQSQLGALTLVNATMRNKQGDCAPSSSANFHTAPAGNQFYNSCATSGSPVKLGADYPSVLENVQYNCNQIASLFDPAPCYTSNYLDNGCGSGTSTALACPVPSAYSPVNAVTMTGKIATLDAQIAALATSDPAYEPAVTERNLQLSWMARYYAFEGANDSAGQLFASHNMYAEALPFYVLAKDLVNSNLMWTYLPSDSLDDQNFKYISKLSIDLLTAGQTWKELTAGQQDTLKNMAQLNRRPGYLAGNVAQLLNIAELKWPIPVTPAVAAHHHHDEHRDANSTDDEGVASGSAALTITGLSIWPNPTSGEFTVRTAIGGTFYLYSLEGKELAVYEVAGDAATFSLPRGLANGLYMGRFRGSDGSSELIRMVYEK